MSNWDELKRRELEQKIRKNIPLTGREQQTIDREAKEEREQTDREEKLRIIEEKERPSRLQQQYEEEMAERRRRADPEDLEIIRLEAKGEELSKREMALREKAIQQAEEQGRKEGQPKEKFSKKLMRMAEKTGDMGNKLAEGVLGKQKKKTITSYKIPRQSYEYGYETELHQDMLAYIKGRKDVVNPGVNFISGKGSHGKEMDMNFITGRGPSGMEMDMNFITGRGQHGSERDMNFLTGNGEHGYEELMRQIGGGNVNRQGGGKKKRGDVFTEINRMI